MSAGLKSFGVVAVNRDKKNGLFVEGIQGPHDPFPPQPAIRATIFNRREAAQRWPGLEKMLEELRDECAKISYPFEMAGVIESRSKLAGIEDDSDMSYGKALVLNLPIEFELYVAELAVQKPSLMLRYSLDKRRLMANYEWYCNLIGGKHCLMVSDCSLYSSELTQCFSWDKRDLRRDSLLFVPVVFVSGNWVACGGFYFDGEDALADQCASYSSINYKAHRHWDEDELEQAEKLAEKVGSAFPWEGRPWLDTVTDSYLTQIFVKESNKEVDMGWP